MASNEETFYISEMWMNRISAMPEKEAGAFIKAIFAYQCNGKVPEMTSPIYSEFMQIKEEFDRNNE